MARHLAWALDGLYVAEAARDYLTARKGEYTAADLPVIWRQQQLAELTARRKNASFVVCDTGPEVIKIWEEVKYGKASPEVTAGFLDHSYDLTLLCHPDLPWEPDPLREAPEQQMRAKLLARYQEMLAEREAFHVKGKARLDQALRAIAEKLAP